MNYKETIREAIRCPQFGDEYYGEWGTLRYEQRLLIKKLLDECDSADFYIRKSYLEKQELIDYLKEKENKLQKKVVYYEKQLKGTERNSFYYSSYVNNIHKLNAQRELIKDILSKIEKE